MEVRGGVAREREVDKPWRFCQSRRGGKDSQVRPYFHDNDMEARVEEARVETKEELGGRGKGGGV